MKKGGSGRFDLLIAGRPWHGKPAPAEVEAAFRIGYFYGASDTFEAVRGAASEHRIGQWLYRRVARWHLAVLGWRIGERKRACDPPPPPRPELTRAELRAWIVSRLFY